jgi:hypothetical protein
MVIFDCTDEAFIVMDPDPGIIPGVSLSNFQSAIRAAVIGD